MVTTIKVVIKFDYEPSTEYLDSYVNNMMEVVDDYCNYRVTLLSNKNYIKYSLSVVIVSNQ